MLMTMGRVEVLHLYKVMLREGQKFPAYNYRKYAVRRIRDAFKENKSLSDSQLIEEKVKFGESNLAMLKRQAAIGQMYQTHKLVIENNGYGGGGDNN